MSNISSSSFKKLFSLGKFKVGAYLVAHSVNPFSINEITEEGSTLSIFL